MTPLNPPFEGGKFSPPPQEGELEGVNLDVPVYKDGRIILILAVGQNGAGLWDEGYAI
jgi:hypothetical protein